MQDSQSDGGDHDAHRIPARDLQAPPPAKVQKVGRKGKTRMRKGDLKRQRKAEALSQAEVNCHYYLDSNGLRRVRPYIYDFKTHAKQRWLDRTVVDVFTKEFGGNPRSHYERMIRFGLLTVNGQRISLDYKLKHADLLCNRTHRHEPPVAGGDIDIVAETAEEIAVDKPCTVPIHPCGSYRFNSLFYILQRQRPDLSLRVCHRLDRLTSGLVILAKTSEKAGVIQTHISSGTTRKVYLARVRGNFGTRLPPHRQQEDSTVSSCNDTGDQDNISTSPPIASVSAEAEQCEDLCPPLKTSGVPSSTGTVAAPDSLDDESQSLWWRYEPLASLEEMQGGQSLEQVTLSRATEPQVKQSQDSVRSGEGDTNKAMDQECDEIKEGGHNATFAMAVRVNCPIRVLDPKDGVYECHAEGKEAQTIRERQGKIVPVALDFNLSRDVTQGAPLPIHVRCIHCCEPDGQVFCKVGYDASSDTSVVRCMPVHGRTHQIRLHLQWINHPIANDPCYGGELFFGDADAERRAEQDPRTRGWRGAGNRVNTYTKEDTREAEVQGVHAKGELITTEDEEERRTNDTNGDKGVPEKSSEHVRENSGDRMAVDRRRSVVLGDEKPTLKVGLSLEVQSTTEHATDSIVDNTKPTGSGTTAAGDGPGDPSEASESTGGNAEEVEEKKDGEDDEAFIVRTCSMCQDGEKFRETQLHCLGIWLHALRYQGPGWSFETKPPHWAVL